ncbi:MAG: sodium:solute symporter family protein [Candidatus Marinimicrobia bacterium]|jgi:SSS family transporter|nr:sodium:solute symporter family protein [Candidatus Neomarinimicrobiota bacterium]MBT3936107.1 sodium:solute symporter family protein [Candidatus Neomarinimicrobiota bacterium]MBT3961078.1 sodium:solute symporter family protein [Candidatus Neomarinimicrobiota bacterium]MBT4383004.1 sodium:solute symporter family protein [Candidatus Neomarinimicrobiota bacterium]MBT4636500.1 sodium:solute symporter family protein [Candidatus Neomarinimicrobiota bacterium]
MIYLITISIYLFTLIGLGVYKSWKIKTQSDFSVAGRSLTPWVLVGTMLATWIGTGSILGNAGKAYQTGLAALMLPMGGVFGIIILTQIAGKVRAFEKFTVPEIIGDRYGSKARILSVIALVIAYMVIVSYQFNAGGAVLKTVLQDGHGNPLITVQTGTIIAAIFIIAYTMLAGLVSVAYTDVANGIIMTLALAIAFPIFWLKAGGWSGMEYSFGQMEKPEHMQFWGVYSGMDILNFCLPPFLLVLGDANMYQRFFASKDAKGAKKATTVLVVVIAIIEILIIASAWVSSSLIPDAVNGRHVLIYAAHSFLPPFIGAIMMTTIVGIIISTADSYLLVPATTLMRDIYQTYINPKVSETKAVLLSRLLVLGLGILAYIVSLGFAKSEGFFERALYAYTIYGAAITPALVAALFWERASSMGAIASIISGTVMTLLWKEVSFFQTILPNGMYQSIDEVLPAILVSIIALVGGSILYPNKR